MDKKFKRIIKIQLIIFTLILFVGYAGSTAELIQDSEAKIAFNKNDFKVYFSDFTSYSGKASALRDFFDNSLNVQTSTSLKQGDNSTIDFTITNNSSQYDAYVYIELDTSNQKEADFNYDEYFEYELTNFKQNEPVLVKAKESEKGKITIKVKKDIPDRTSLSYKIKLNIKITSIERTEKAIPKYHTITFDPNGGECTELTRIVEEGTQLGNLPTPTRDEYKFNYWMNVKNYKIAFSSDYIMEDMTYKAQWEPTINEIFYDANGGTGTMENSKFDINKHGKLRKNTYVRPEYIFEGWAYKPDATTPDFADEATFIDNALIPRHDVKLYAVWRKEIMDTKFDISNANALADIGYTYEKTDRKIYTNDNQYIVNSVYEIHKDGKIVTNLSIPEYYQSGKQKYRVTGITNGLALFINIAKGNDTLETITLPNSITEIDGFAFQSFTALKNIKLNNGIKKIGGYAFSNCDSLTSIVLPNSVEEIADQAFSYSDNFKSFNFPTSIKRIGSGAFEETAITSLTIPSYYKNINDNAFYNMKKLTNLTIPEGVETIGKEAFMQAAITKLVLPSSIKSIGEEAFMNNTNLANVYIESNNLTLGKNCFNQIKKGTTSAYGSTIYVRSSSIRDTLLSNPHTGILTRETDYIVTKETPVMASEVLWTQVSTNYKWKI